MNPHAVSRAAFPKNSSAVPHLVRRSELAKITIECDVFINFFIKRNYWFDLVRIKSYSSIKDCGDFTNTQPHFLHS